MNVYTIGTNKKTAKQFFELLKKNGIKKVIDIRLNNKSQLAGFTKGVDLQYFLSLFDIEYEHNLMLAPTEALRKMYNNKKVKMPFEEYTQIFENMLEKSQVIEELQKLDLDSVCFLCSEEKPDECHRSLVVKRLKCNNVNIKITHL